MRNKNKEGFNPKLKGVEVVEEDNPEIPNAIPTDSVQTVASQVSAPEGIKSKRKSSLEKTVLKPGVTGQVIQGSGAISPDLPSDVTTFSSMVFSGTDANISSNVSEVSERSKTRSNSRYGRKTDAPINRIDDIISEQVFTEIEAPAPLRDSASKVQGYRGQEVSNTAKVQKVAGGVPSEIDFHRSVDILAKDQYLFASGQMINSDRGELNHDFPTQNSVISEVGGVKVVQDVPFNSKKGNYIPRSLEITIHKDGYVSEFKINEDKILDKTFSQDTVNASAQHAHTDRRTAELIRKHMEDKAGNESDPGWSPLPLAVNQPTRLIHYAMVMEREVGNTMFLANMKSQVAMAYQLNKAAKDGRVIKRPLAEYLMGSVAPGLNPSEFEGSGLYADPFSKVAMRNGSPAMLVAINDSLTKYKNSKGKINALPQGFKTQITTMQNHIGVFKASQDFINLVLNNELFSTMDGEYDPLKPVVVTDLEALVYSQSWKEQFEYTSDGVTKTFTHKPLGYSFDELRGKYRTELVNPILAGINDFFENNATRLYDELSEGNSDTIKIKFPIVYSTTSMSLWQLLLCGASDYIAMQRLNSFKDFLKYEKNHGYPFSNLVSLRDHADRFPISFGFRGIDQPLVVGRISDAAKPRVLTPEVFNRIVESGDDDVYLLPFYFSENMMEVSTNKVFRMTPDNRHNMSWPVYGSGIRHSTFEEMLKYDPRDYRLALDVMTEVPVYGEVISTAYVYKYAQREDGLIAVKFPNADLTAQAIFDTPRQLGLIMDAPLGTLRRLSLPSTLNYSDTTFNTLLEGGSSYSLTVYHNKELNTAKANDGKILRATYANMDRGSDFSQTWTRIFARLGSVTNVDTGYAFSLGELFDRTRALVEGKGVFTPFTDGYTVQSASAGEAYGTQTVISDNNFKLVSMHKYFVFAIQFLPFFSNPFEAVANSRVTAFDDGVKVDPYEIPRYFGLKGFLATDYYEDHQNRMARAVQTGPNYTRDMYLDDTLLVK